MKADGEYHVKVEVIINSEVISCAAANQNSKVARKLAAQEALCKLKVCFGSFAFYFLNCYSILFSRKRKGLFAFHFIEKIGGNEFTNLLRGGLLQYSEVAVIPGGCKKSPFVVMVYFWFLRLLLCLGALILKDDM
jgi:hypothetical protein